MTDLQATSGLPLWLADSGDLVIGSGIAPIEAVPRLVGELRSVLADRAAVAGSGDAVAYLMYRGLALATEAARLAEFGLRYDLTLLKPGSIGREFVKTAGHYHPDAPSGVPYPEVYEVLAGQAAFLLQKAGASGISDAAIVYAGPGDKLHFPPGYGHVSINIGPGPLVIGNIVAEDFESVYGDYRSRRGAAYYLLAGMAGPQPAVNPHYGDLPPLRLAPPSHDPVLGLDARPLLAAWRDNPSVFEYCVHPELLPAGLRP